jgi:hypothetical protein
MAKSSRTGNDTPKARRRRRSPVLELKATETGGQSGAARDEKPKSGGKQQAPGAAAKAAWERLRAQAAAAEWRGIVSMPVLTGAAGVIAGALIVFLLMPRGGETADPRVGELAGEVANLSARIESLATRPVPAPAPDQSGLGERIDKLTSAIGEAEQRLAAVEQRPEPKAPDFSAVEQRTAAMENMLRELRGGLTDLKRVAEQTPATATPQAIEGIASRIGGLEERIAALAAKPAAPAAPAARPASAAEFVALNRLTGAVRSGRPFVKELETARTLLGERAAPLAALEPHAAKGLPDIAELERRFAALVPELLRAPEAEGNFLERLLGNASRLVQVRRVGEPEGDSIEAIVARTETKLARGELEGAIVEADSLPEPAKSQAASWLASAKQRRDAEALVADVLDATLSGHAEREKS